MSNRVICIRNHIILAGLLNRTLVVDTLQPGYTKRRYSWPILFDTQHLNACFGPRSVVTTAEYQRRHGRQKKLTIDKLLCWAVRPEWDKTALHILQTTCPEDACQDLDLAPFKKTMAVDESGAGFRENVCAKSVADVVQTYGQKWGGERTILAGDLALFGLFLPSAFTSSIDVPFTRSPGGCGSALAILPHPRIVQYARERAQALFSGAPFLALHWRRKDFVTDRCLKKRWASVCTPTANVASCLAHQVKAMGIANVVVCSDAKGRELDVLTKLTTEAVGDTVSIVVNPQLPRHMGSLVGWSKEGSAMLQKLIMAHSAVFLGTDHSSFTGDVQRLRHGLATASCRDSFICEGVEYQVNALDPFLAMLI